MADLPTPGQITSLASLLAPGLIIATIRDRAITGSTPDIKERLLTYGIVSAGYFAAVTPLFHVRSGPSLSPWLWSFLQYFAVPVVAGIALAYITNGVGHIGSLKSSVFTSRTTFRRPGIIYLRAFPRAHSCLSN